MHYVENMSVQLFQHKKIKLQVGTSQFLTGHYFAYFHLHEKFYNWAYLSTRMLYS